MAKYLLDTCALSWWTLDPNELSPKAKKACQKIEQTEGMISSISIWEIGVKIKNRKLERDHQFWLAIYLNGPVK